MAELFNIRTFNYVSKSQITDAAWNDVADTYPAVVGSPNADQPEGRIQGTALETLYLLGLSCTYSINSTGNSAQARFSLDGGATWEDFSRESKDSTDRQTFDYMFPYPMVAGAYDIVVQLKKENASNTMQVHFLNLWLERKG